MKINVGGNNRWRGSLKNRWSDTVDNGMRTVGVCAGFGGSAQVEVNNDGGVEGAVRFGFEFDPHGASGLKPFVPSVGKRRRCTAGGTFGFYFTRRGASGCVCSQISRRNNMYDMII